MVEAGQVFKNYKELCAYMGEEVKGGTEKMSQMRKWGYLFSWHKEGYKIIIDEVFEDGEIINPYDSHNDKRVNLFLPYVRNKLLCVDPDEYLGTQRLIGTTLRLIPMNAYKQINGRGMKGEEFYKKHGLGEVGS